MSRWFGAVRLVVGLGLVVALGTLLGCGAQSSQEKVKAPPPAAPVGAKSAPAPSAKPTTAAAPAGGDKHAGHDHAGHDHAPAAVKPAKKADPEGLKELSPADRTAAEKQAICPVTEEPLGSMGTPVKATVKGRTVFLCCEGCEGDLKKDPDKYLARLDGAK